MRTKLSKLNPCFTIQIQSDIIFGTLNITIDVNKEITTERITYEAFNSSGMSAFDNIVELALDNYNKKHTQKP